MELKNKYYIFKDGKSVALIIDQITVKGACTKESVRCSDSYRYMTIKYRRADSPESYEESYHDFKEKNDLFNEKELINR